jgi:hypothetical protein
LRNRQNSEVIAPESIKTKRARSKLLKQVASIESKISAKALEKKSLEIHRWIARHAPSRVVLHSKTISLFDENRNAAILSKKIEVLAARLREEMRPV